MTGLFPAIEPYHHDMLAVGDGNQVYWETCGNPLGKPAVVVHGGPGSGCTAGSGACSIRLPTGSCCSTREAVGEAPPCERSRHRPDEQYHVEPHRGHGVAARASGDRALAGARWLMGQHAGPGLRGAIPGPRYGSDSVRGHDGTPRGVRLAVSRGGSGLLSGAVGAIAGGGPTHRGGSRSRRCVPPDAVRPGPHGAATGCTRVVPVGVRDTCVASDGGTVVEIRGPRIRAGVRALGDTLRPPQRVAG